jgi:Zn-dependent peptidase ImmA (M78 family)
MAQRTFRYELSWTKELTSALSAEEATWGDLCIRVDRDLLWGAREDGAVRGYRWTWIDLLEHLAEVWPWLSFEEGWPAGPVIRDPTHVLSEARSWVASLPGKEAAEKEDALFEYRHRHDLAMAVRGKLLPQLWIVREGEQAWVVGEAVARLAPIEDVGEGLASLGDAICARLSLLEDERARAAIDAWRARMALDVTALAAISVGVDEADLLQLADGDIASTFEVDVSDTAEGFAPNELLAAARMAVPSTDPSVVRGIVAAMKSIPKRATSELDELSQRARTALAGLGGGVKAAHAGYHLARFLREALRLADSERAEPEAMLTDWGVRIDKLAANDDAIEAVACWGPAHGPAILVNDNGRHSQDPAGRRATLAHEIAHLLVDRHAALPLAEVLGGHVSRPVEQRARAFAAELLVPCEAAGAAFLHDADTKGVLEALCAQYGASREIVAWQAYNSGYAMVWSTYSLLRQQVSHPHRFLWPIASKS